LLGESQILQIIAQGENSGVEFKQDEVNPEALEKEIVAFANSNGGVILLGVEDDGRISGISNSQIKEEWVSNIVRNNVIPPLQVSSTIVEVAEKKVFLIEVPKGKDKPYQTNKFQFLIRIGSTNRVATQAELLRLFQQSGALHYDKIGIDHTSISSLNFAKLDSYFNIFEIKFDEETPSSQEQLLKNAEILTEEGQVTLAGMLCFGINPSKYLHQSGIAFAHFNGNEITDELIDRQFVEGTLDYVIDTTLAVVKNNIKAPSIIVGTKRVETANGYPDKVFRELIANACVHRDYSIIGSQIRLFMFEDRLEMHSPGRLPNTLSIEKIKFGSAYSRNPVLLKFLIHTRYVDRLGRGIPMIYQEANKLGKPIKMEEFGEEFIVTLYF
jgi:ATP-dependent DNA helicase RecG